MARKTKLRWGIALAAIGGLYLIYGGASGDNPDQEIAKHFEAICGVAKKHIDSPRSGVVKLSRYFGDHSPAMLQSFGALLVQIERIDDDAQHDRRARQAAKVMRQPLMRCESTFERFFAAVESDPEARRMLEQRLERLGRTLEILLGASAQNSSIKHPSLQTLRRAAPWLAPMLGW